MRHPFRWLLNLRKKEPGLKTIRELARELDVSRLMGDEETPLHFDPRDFRTEDWPARLFGYYSAEGVRYALEELGVFRLIEARGFTDFRVSISGDAWRQLLRIHGRAKGENHLVSEGRFRRMPWTVPDEAYLLKSACRERAYDVAFIDWLTLQNPLAEFSPDRPRLPGQDHPGLGILHEVMEVFYAVANRLKLDAYLASADHFHNAAIYTPSFFFVDPQRQAELDAIRRAGEGRSLQDMALAMEGGHLYRRDRAEAYEWRGDLMINPLAHELQEAHRRLGYAERVEDMAGNMEFFFDWPAFDKSRPALMAEVFGEGTE